LGGAPSDTGDRAQELNRGGERGDLLLDCLRELLDRLVEEVDVGEDPADDQRVLRAEATRERFPEREVSQHFRVGRARNERVQHRPPRLAQRSEATQSSLIPVSCITLCSRLASRWRSRIWLLR